MSPPGPEMRARPDPDRRWRLQAACRGLASSVMFPVDEAGEYLAEQICRDCPVIAKCRAYALGAYEQDGVWGGLTADQRRRIWKRERIRRLT